MKNLEIIGASGHGKVVLDIAIKLGQWETIIFFDDNKDLKSLLNYKVVGAINDIEHFKENSDFFVAIGNNAVRRRVFKKLLNSNYSLTNLIHPNATIGVGVKIGQGNVIMAGVVLNSSVKIGNGCIINTLSSIDHDCNILDFVHVSPG